MVSRSLQTAGANRCFVLKTTLKPEINRQNRERLPGVERIALLTPYGGTNLGDGAIQSAVIAALKRFFPGAELWGITLDPWETAKQNCIPGFPMTGLFIPFYSESLFEPIEGFFLRFRKQSSFEKSNEDQTREPCHVSLSRRIWESLKTIPFIGSVFRLLLRSLRTIFMIIHEIRHLRTSLRFVRNLDAVIVSGGGQLDEAWGGPWGHPYAIFRWALLTRLTGKKFIVMSVGVSELRTKLSRFFTMVALKMACYRSYRDHVSKALLGEWSFTWEDNCVPDLAFSLQFPRAQATSFSTMCQPKVAVCPIAFGHVENWPKPAPQIYERYILNLSLFIAGLTEKGYQVLLFKSSGADRRAVWDLQERISHCWPTNVADSVFAPTVETVGEFLCQVRQVSFVVASRLHSVILGHIVGKPVLAISFDQKVDTHMCDVEQCDYVLDIRSFTSIGLGEKFEGLVKNAENIQRIVSKHVLCFQALLERQYIYLGGWLKSRN